MQRIRNSLSAKVFLWVAGALALCSFLIYGLVMLTLPKQYSALALSRIAAETDQLVLEIAGADYDSARERIYDFCIQNQAAAVLTTGEETVVFGSGAGLQGAKDSYSVSMVLPFSDRVESGILTVVAASSATAEIAHSFLRLFPLAAVAILALSALSAWACSRLLVGPVLQISSVSERMAQMDLTWHCPSERTDELGTLARSLNTLSERLTEAMGELESANAQLRRDVDASRRLEEERRNFFAAASHELKTPLAIIKGQLESMALGIGDYQNHEKYFPQVLAVVARMERLIREILLISKMESGVPDSSFAVEPLAPLLQACLTELEPLAQERQIRLECGPISPSVSVRINRQLFQKAITNILSNAICYSAAGQCVTVALTACELTVENTGASIAEEDLPSLFAPFYRADPSRSRESGGSGLGLFLVKTILERHGFPYRIENVENAVRFTMILNQNKTE